MSRHYPSSLEGSLLATPDAHFAICAARFNDHVVGRLLLGAQEGLARFGVDESHISVVRVPGAWELPLACAELAKTGRFAAVVALGAVIRGETPHFDYVAGQAATGLARVALDTGVPVIFGVLTTDTLEHAEARAGGKDGNRGFDAAQAAVEMANLTPRNPRAGLMNKTGARSTAREAALQLLYALEASGEPEGHVLRTFWHETPGNPEGRPYAEELFSGTLARLAEIDDRIREASDNWRVERMSRVDRNVLRVGTYELMQRSDVPRAVIIDEAIELAKRYGSEGSGKFVNGVLERVATELGRTDPGAHSEGESP